MAVPWEVLPASVQHGIALEEQALGSTVQKAQREEKKSEGQTEQNIPRAHSQATEGTGQGMCLVVLMRTGITILKLKLDL